MLTISSDFAIYRMSPSNEPAARVQSGATLRFETLDCFAGQIKSDEDLVDNVDFGSTNPATGPLYVEGAEPGDILRVDILDLKVADRGCIAVGAGGGSISRLYKVPGTRIFPVRDGRVIFNDRLSFAAEPMIGVIGTAPADGQIFNTGTPDKHGGNMDCRRITAGTALFLPVNVPGALLAMGDLHALMADGEADLCGVEIAGLVTVKVTVIKGCTLPLPFLLTDRDFMTIASAATLDEAALSAALAMHSFLTGALGMDTHEAGMLESVAGQLRICQMVDPQKTCRMEMPLYVAKQYGYSFPK